jgi:hypothetical protein
MENKDESGPSFADSEINSLLEIIRILNNIPKRARKKILQCLGVFYDVI